MILLSWHVSAFSAEANGRTIGVDPPLNISNPVAKTCRPTNNTSPAFILYQWLVDTIQDHRIVLCFFLFASDFELLSLFRFVEQQRVGGRTSERCGRAVEASPFASFFAASLETSVFLRTAGLGGAGGGSSLKPKSKS